MPKAYENAGVSVEAGYEVVKRIKSHVARTNRPGVVGGIGGFGGLFDLASLGYKEPVLISGTDGVGTKLMVAKLANKHDTIGIDCVAMCVNDIAAQGAEPLFFLDYIACGKNDPALLEQVVAGVADGCVQAGSALVGGETAEMPGMYDEDVYVKALSPLFKAGVVKGVAHITGGGFIENIPRMIPDGLAAEIELGTWPVLPIFDVLEKAGNIDHKEMYNIFNMGIGMVLAIDPARKDEALKLLADNNEPAYVLGQIAADTTGTQIVLK